MKERLKKSKGLYMINRKEDPIENLLEIRLITLAHVVLFPPELKEGIGKEEVEEGHNCLVVEEDAGKDIEEERWKAS